MSYEEILPSIGRVFWLLSGIMLTIVVVKEVLLAKKEKRSFDFSVTIGKMEKRILVFAGMLFVIGGAMFLLGIS